MPTQKQLKTTQKAGRKAPVSQAKAPAKTQGGKAHVTQAKAPAKTQGGKAPATPAKAQGGKAPTTQAKAQGGKAPTSQAKPPAKTRGGKAPASQADTLSNKKIILDGFMENLFENLITNHKTHVTDNILNKDLGIIDFTPNEKNILNNNEGLKLKLLGFLKDVFKPTLERTEEDTQRINNLMNDSDFLYKINQLLSYYCLHIENKQIKNKDTIKKLYIIEIQLIQNTVHIINYELYKLNLKKIPELVDLHSNIAENERKKRIDIFVNKILNSYEESKKFLNAYAHLSRIGDIDDLKVEYKNIELIKKDIPIIYFYYEQFKDIIKQLFIKLTIPQIKTGLFEKEAILKKILNLLGTSNLKNNFKESFVYMVNNLGIFPDMEAFYSKVERTKHTPFSQLKTYIIQLIQTRESAISLKNQPVIDELEYILVYFIPFMINEQLQEQREKEKQLVIDFIKATKLDEFIDKSRRTSTNMIAKCRSGLNSLNWNKGTYEFESNWKQKFIDLNDDEPFNTLGKGIHYVLNKCPNEFKIHLDNLKNKANTLNQANKLKFILNDSKLEIKNRAKVIISIEKFIKRYLNDVQAWT